MLRIGIVAVAALALSSCGFRPLYAEATGDVAQQLSEIAVAEIPSPEASGFLVQKELTRRLSAPADIGSATWDLEVKVEESKSPFAIQIDASVTRFDYELIGVYKLTNRITGVVHESTARAAASYNVLNSQFATLAAEQEAREKAARLLAERIQLDIALKLADLEG